jgi:hypothetical protein
MRDCMPACRYAKLYVVHRGCPGDARRMPGDAKGMPGGCPGDARGSGRYSGQRVHKFLNDWGDSKKIMSRFFSWDVKKSFSNQMAPNPIIFLNRDNFPPIFRKGSVVFLGNTFDIRLRDSM